MVKAFAAHQYIIQQSIETLEELAREHVNDSLAVMEYRYELRQMSKFGFLSGLISAPRAHVERNVAKAVLQGSPKNLRTALMVLSTFPPVRCSVSPLRQRRVIIRSRTPSTSSLHRASRFVDGERNARRSRTRSPSSPPRRRRSTTSRAPWHPSSPTTRPSGLDSALIQGCREAQPRHKAHGPEDRERPPRRRFDKRGRARIGTRGFGPVSYTHLTLPTKA